MNYLLGNYILSTALSFSLREEIIHFTGIEIQSVRGQMAFLEPPVPWFRLFIH